MWVIVCLPQTLTLPFCNSPSHIPFCCMISPALEWFWWNCQSTHQDWAASSKRWACDPSSVNQMPSPWNLILWQRDSEAKGRRNSFITVFLLSTISFYHRAVLILQLFLQVLSYTESFQQILWFFFSLHRWVVALLFASTCSHILNTFFG